MTTDDQWTIVSHHECGHVIGYTRFGLRFGSVRIYQTEDGNIQDRVPKTVSNSVVIRRTII
jgi:hypothetical protein